MAGLKFVKISKNISIEKILFAVALFYVSFPVILFAFGWLHLYYAIPLTALLLAMGYFIMKDISKEAEVVLICKKNVFYWIVSAFVISLWVYISGIGRNVFQNYDFWVRNPIFRDLCTENWPVIYDLSKEPEYVQNLIGSEKVLFAYYFAWWLPASAISKVFALETVMRHVVLLCWAFLGCMLVLFMICRMLKKCSYVPLLLFVFFGGLDVIPYYIIHGEIPLTEHIEWWAEFFQYSSNSALITNVFNQSIPIWLIAVIVLQLKDSKYIAAVGSLIFAYSAWGIFGIVPIIIAASIRNRFELKKALNAVNIFIPAFMLVVYGTFYTASNGSSGGVGTIFARNDGRLRQVMLAYLLFVLVEFGAYFIALGKDAVYNKYYVTVLIELLLFPLFQIRDYNFTMRGSICPLFILSFWIMKYLVDNWSNPKEKLRRNAIIVILVIAAFPAVIDLNRAVHNTFNDPDNMVNDSVISFADMQIDVEYFINTARGQFFVDDYTDSFFGKYLLKENDY